MQIPVSDAKANLTELVRRAEAGEEIVLTRHGKQTVRLVPVRQPQTLAERRAIIEEVRARAATRPDDGVSAARSQDFLYDENGMPG